MFALTNHSAQRIAGNDLGAGEMFSCPRRLARGGRADQHDQARRRDLDGLADQPRLELRPVTASSGGNEFATIDFGTKHVVAQPESDTADGVDEAQFRSTQLELAAQVGQVDVDHVRVANPVRAVGLSCGI